MARKNRRRDDEVRPLGPGYASRTVESHPDGDWVVQRISGQRAVKEYRCPGCDQVVAPGTPHVVAYRDDDAGYVASGDGLLGLGEAEHRAGEVEIGRAHV